MMTMFISGNVNSQEDKKANDTVKQETAKSDTKPDASAEKQTAGSYLDISHARENAIKYDEDIRDDIYKLQVVVANFGEASDKSALESIRKDHVNGKKELFKRKYLSSATILKKVKADIRSLLINLSNRYQTKTNEILGLCAETLVDKEMGLNNTSDSNAAAKVSRKITQNRIKLVIAYDHLNMGDKFKFDDRLSDAVTHYRLAKLHGINILVDMAESESDKDNVKNQYKVDLSDGENLVSK